MIATLASCSNDDNIDNTEQNGTRQITFTAMLAPKGDNGSGTRAITVENQGTTSEILNVAWRAGEQIAIYYQKNDDSYATAMATVGTPNADGSAPFTATLTNAKGGTAKFIYPYSLADKNGELKMKGEYSFRTQGGTIEYISQYLDAATATGTIDVTGGTATVSGKITMENQCCICKFNFIGLRNEATENFYNITIKEKDGSSTKNTYQTTSIVKSSMNTVYMALLGATGKDFKFSIQGYHKNSATDESGTPKNYYEAIFSNVTLTAGLFYRSITVVSVQTITGNLTNSVVIPDGASLIMDGATISVNEGTCISCEGDATIILAGSNCITTTDGHGSAAIQAGPAGKTLTIKGNGSLTVSYDSGSGIGSSISGTCGDIVISGGTIVVSTTYGSYNAAIGSGMNGQCGNITINGGTVEATGGNDSPGIGSGDNGKCGDITISGTNTHIKAIRDDNAQCSIGKGTDEATCGTVTIGGTVYYQNNAFVGDGATYLATNPLLWQWPNP